MSRVENPGLNQNPPWNLDPVSHAGPELSSKISATKELYDFLRSRERGLLSAFFSSIEELRHAVADKNSQGGDMCGRFDLMEQLIGAAYLPQGNRTPQERIKIARASWPFMSPDDKGYEQKALDELKK